MPGMSGVPPGSDGLAAKIARLVEERGWNQEDFARITKLNRQTVRQILLNQGRRPHNTTFQACAKALSLTVGEQYMGKIPAGGRQPMRVIGGLGSADRPVRSKQGQIDAADTLDHIGS